VGVGGSLRGGQPGVAEGRVPEGERRRLGPRLQHAAEAVGVGHAHDLRVVGAVRAEGVVLPHGRAHPGGLAPVHPGEEVVLHPAARLGQGVAVGAARLAQREAGDHQAQWAEDGLGAVAVGVGDQRGLHEAVVDLGGDGVAERVGRRDRQEAVAVVADLSKAHHKLQFRLFFEGVALRKRTK
jgi:hypothetical protein